MTNEEAITIIDGIRNEYSFNSNKKASDCLKALNMAIEALKAKTDGDILEVKDGYYIRHIENNNKPSDLVYRPSADTEWMPCSERLPSEDGCYLVSTTGTNNDIIDIAYYTEEIWHKASRIKAWMPLPKPYREDGEA